MDNDRLGILLIMLGVSLFTVQDALIKYIADTSSLLQIFITRGFVGGVIVLCYMRLSKIPLYVGSAYPLLSFTRSVLFYFGFLSFYMALAVLPLAEAVSLFFISPLFITLLSKFLMKNDVGWYRMSAIIIGFIGTLLIVKPNVSNFNWFYLLPIFCAFSYAMGMMIAKITREKDTVFQQLCHIYMGSVTFGLITYFIGGGFGLNESSNSTLIFLFRDWSFDNFVALTVMLVIACFGTCGILSLISAYRIGDPPVIAPFEYTMMILSIFTGYFIFGEIPDIYSFFGMMLISGCGLLTLAREGVRKQSLGFKNRLR